MFSLQNDTTAFLAELNCIALNGYGIIRLNHASKNSFKSALANDKLCQQSSLNTRKLNMLKQAQRLTATYTGTNNRPIMS